MKLRDKQLFRQQCYINGAWVGARGGDSITGSTEVGKTLLEHCAATVKKESMELGGNAPFIVFDDAELDKAVEGVMASKFRNAGQTWVCANRIFVHSDVYDTFKERLATAVSTLRVGSGVEPGVTIDPLIDIAAVEQVEQHIDDATAKGAAVFSGGKRHANGGTFFEPTILTDVMVDAMLMNEETFGPVAPLIRFTSENEVIQKANDTEFGLACYFYSRDIGREGSKYGIDDYVEIKYMCIGGLQ